MPRLVVVVVIIIIIIAALFFLSTLPKERPTKTIEVAVPQPATSGGNAN